MEKFLKRALLGVGVVCVSVSMLTACNTVKGTAEGAGKDVTAVGNAIAPAPAVHKSTVHKKHVRKHRRVRKVAPATDATSTTTDTSSTTTSTDSTPVSSTTTETSTTTTDTSAQ